MLLMLRKPEWNVCIGLVIRKPWLTATNLPVVLFTIRFQTCHMTFSDYRGCHAANTNLPTSYNDFTDMKCLKRIFSKNAAKTCPVCKWRREVLSVGDVDTRVNPLARSLKLEFASHEWVEIRRWRMQSECNVCCWYHQVVAWISSNPSYSRSFSSNFRPYI
jgi:hypothetical protein